MSTDNEPRRLSSSQIARLIYSAREELGWEISDPAELLNRIKMLEAGLPAEDEFITLVNWLGRCKLIHKLDQEQYPLTSKDLYQVPDLFAVFERDGGLVPVLVEVKTSKKNLSWKPSYLERLKRYSDLLHLPLLIACKLRLEDGDRGLAFWLLFDAEL